MANDTGNDVKQEPKPKSAPPAPAPTKVRVTYIGPSHVFDDTGYSGEVFERNGDPQSVTAEDAERLRSYPHNQFEVTA